MSDENRNVAFPDSPKIGRFLIRYEHLYSGADRPWLKALFALCLPLEIVDHESGRGREYCCQSELFQDLKEGETIPMYRIACDLDRPFTEEENRKAVGSGRFKFYAVRQIIVRVPPASIHLNPQSVH